MQPTINYLAILVTAIMQMILGSLWYGPLFGKPWMAMMGITPEQMQKAKLPEGKAKMQKSYAIMFVSSLIMGYVLSHFVWYTGATTFTNGMQTGFWIWLGFLTTTMLGSVLWENKPWRLYYLNVGYYLVTLLLTGGVLAIWR